MTRPDGSDLVLHYRKCNEVLMLLLLLLSRCLHILQLQHLTLNMAASTLRTKAGWVTVDCRTHTHAHTQMLPAKLRLGAGNGCYCCVL